jgi:hypothetical protein
MRTCRGAADPTDRARLVREIVAGRQSATLRPEQPDEGALIEFCLWQSFGQSIDYTPAQ